MEYSKMSLKDFESSSNLSLMERANFFKGYLDYLDKKGYLNYRLVNQTGCAPEITISDSSTPKPYISYVSNDYLGFTQHPKVKSAAIAGIEKYGTGAGASPLIGGLYDFHQEIEEKMALFFGRDKKSCILYNTGYAANSATLQCLLSKEDLAILDMGVHTSVFEGCILTNTKTFLHNHLDSLERILKNSINNYRTILVIIDGVYSQDGDIAKVKEIYELTKKYNAFLMVDDAHGVGIKGKTGRGILQEYDLLDKVDFITGTYSKTFANIGGYVIAHPNIIQYLKYNSKEQIFSATSSPSALGIIKAIELIDEEPQWQQQLLSNIEYFTRGLLNIGLDIGNTESAIIPVKIGDAELTMQTGKILLENGIYANPIQYPAVSKKNARIRMSLTATHTKKQLDQTLNIFEYVNKKLHIAKN